MASDGESLYRLHSLILTLCGNGEMVAALGMGNMEDVIRVLGVVQWARRGQYLIDADSVVGEVQAGSWVVVGST